MTTKLKITNIFGSPYGANTVSGTVHLAAGETRELEFTDGEAANIRGNTKVFKVEGETAAGAGVSTGGNSADVDRVTKERDQARALLTEIAALFDDPAVNPGNLKDHVAQVIELADAADPHDQTKPTLAEAVAALDDTKAEHWIASGKPNLDHLESVTGTKPTRAEVDALKRERKTA